MIAEKVADTRKMTREEWLEHRRKGIGGSDITVLMGVNPWKSPMDVWLEKTEEFDTEDEDNEVMYWGRVLEDIVAREFTERTGKKVRKKNSILRHPGHYFLMANVDRLVIGEKTGLECKTTNAFYQDNGQCPELYYAQAQHYMTVTGYEKWYVAVLAGGQRFYIYEVLRDTAYIDEIIKAAQYFWHLVEKGKPPEFDGSEASSRIVARMYPRATEEEAELPADAFTLVHLYDEAAEEEKAAKTRKDEAANKLKAMLGEAEKGFVYDRKVSWTNVEGTRLDTKKLKENEPEIYEKYTKTSNYRRFQVK